MICVDAFEFDLRKCLVKQYSYPIKSHLVKQKSVSGQTIESVAFKEHTYILEVYACDYVHILISIWLYSCFDSSLLFIMDHESRWQVFMMQLAEEPATKGLRKMEPKDVPAVARLFAEYQNQFKIYPEFSGKRSVNVHASWVKYWVRLTQTRAEVG